MEVGFIIVAPIGMLMGIFLVTQIVLSGMADLFDWFISFVTGVRRW
ncbi:MAG: hypothetical protein SF162_07605 [bacterium]|nr:hypothetical protein [bacterium]